MNALLSCLTVLLAGAAAAQQGQGIHLVDRTPGECRNAAFLDSRHVLTADGGLLRVWDVENPGEPGLVGSLTLPGIILDLEVEGSLAWLAAAGHGLLAIDLQDPARPVVRHHVELPTLAYGLALREDRLALSHRVPHVRSNGLQLFSLEQDGPHSLGELGPVCFYGDDVHLDPGGSVAHMTGWWEWVPVDISDPWMPVESPALPWQQVGLVADMAFLPRGEGEVQLGLVARGSDGLDCFSFETPNAPQPLSHLGPPHVAFGVKVMGDLALVAGDGLRIYDLSQAPDLAPLGVLPLPLDPGDEPQGLDVLDSLALLPCGSTAHLVDLHDMSDPVIVAHMGGPTHRHALPHAAGGVVLVVEDGTVLATLGDLPQGRLAVLGRLDLGVPVVAIDLCADGTRAVVLDDHLDLHVVDLTDPATPMRLGGLHLPQPCGAVAISPDGTWAVAGGGGQLYRLDLATPQQPILVDTVDVGWLTGALAMAGDLLAAGGEGRIHLWDHQSGSLEWQGSVTFDGSVMDLEMTDSSLAAAVTETGLWVWDVAEPGAPALRSRLWVNGQASQVEAMGELYWVAEDYMYILQEDPRLLLVDPGAQEAEIVAWWRLDGGRSHMAVTEGRVLLEVGSGDLQLLEADPTVALPTPTPEPGAMAWELLEAAPNPFNPTTSIRFRTSGAGPVKFEVFDLGGRRVRLVEDSVLGAGTHSRVLAADGLASGVYLLRLEADGQKRTGRVLLLK